MKPLDEAVVTPALDAHLRQESAREAHTPLVVVTVGSQIRFNTGLLQQVHQQPGHRSSLVEVERLIREADGTVTIWIKHAAVGAVVGLA